MPIECDDSSRSGFSSFYGGNIGVIHNTQVLKKVVVPQFLRFLKYTRSEHHFAKPSTSTQIDILHFDSEIIIASI